MKLQNFHSGAMLTAFEVTAACKLPDFEAKLKVLLEAMPLNHIYIETYRGGHFSSKDDLLKLKAIFEAYGVKASAAITTTSSHNPMSTFDAFCYSKKENQDKIVDIITYTASLFDEIILDDFFFTDCKCESCISAKGDRSWKDYRLETMSFVAKKLILETARKVNPKIKVILKYPNWYEYYQETGYNLDLATGYFDAIYTGTETRNPTYTQQTIPSYNSYFLMRYLEEVSADNNAGGWFDSIDCSYNLNSVVEQAQLTLFAKAKESTFYTAGALMSYDAIFAPLLGFTYKKLDELLPKLGTPAGISTYKPLHSQGENFLHSYLGMLGIPFNPSSHFPKGAGTIFLTASAQHDSNLVQSIKTALLDGATIWLTSGLAKALQNKGLEELISLEVTEQSVSSNAFAHSWLDCSYKCYMQSSKPIVFRQMNVPTNATTNDSVALAHFGSTPILSTSAYGKGKIHVLNIPSSLGQLYDLPTQLLSHLRSCLLKDSFVTIQGEGQYSVFTYDNHTFIIQSFSEHTSPYTVIVPISCKEITNLETGETYKIEEVAATPIYNAYSREQPTAYKKLTLMLNAHRYIALKAIY